MRALQIVKARMALESIKFVVTIKYGNYIVDCLISKVHRLPVPVALAMARPAPHVNVIQRVATAEAARHIVGHFER